MSATQEMSLQVALDFADHPRPKSTLQAPADTMDELREALRVIARALRATQPAAGGESDPVAWRWRECIGDEWSSWRFLATDIDTFRQSAWSFNLSNGTAEVQSLYGTPYAMEQSADKSIMEQIAHDIREGTFPKKSAAAPAQNSSLEVLIQGWMADARQLEEAAKQEDIGDEESALNKYCAEQLRKCIRDVEGIHGTAQGSAMTEMKRHGACQVCGEVADLKSGPSRFGNETWACLDCWQPEETGT